MIDNTDKESEADLVKALIEANKYIMKIERENREMRQIVEFYADPNNWQNMLAMVSMLKETRGGERGRDCLRRLFGEVSKS